MKYLSKYDYEVGIIGGGPAGSTAANYLAENGIEVCLFERNLFPRDVLCGEFLSKEVIVNLKRMEIYKKFLSLKPNQINCFRLINHGQEFVSEIKFPAYSLRRSDFDKLLLDSANANGTVVYQPAEVKQLIKNKSNYEVIFNFQNELKKIKVKYLIAATGKKSNIDKLLRRNFINYNSGLTGIKFHLGIKNFVDFKLNEISIHLDKNVYCGINAINDNKVTVCFLERKNDFNANSETYLNKLTDGQNKLSELFKFSDQGKVPDLNYYGAGNIYFGKKELIKDGIFMIGDAAGMIAPLSGDGIGIAMESGRLLTEIFINSKRYNLSNSFIEEDYFEKWNNLFESRLKTAHLIQSVFFSNYLKKFGLNVIKIFPSLIPKLVDMTRN